MSDHVNVSGRHPEPDALIDLAEGLLPEKERAPVLDHLRRCGDCESLFRDAVRSLETARSEVAAGLGLESRAASPTRIVALPVRDRLRWTALAPLAAAAVLAFALIGPGFDASDLDLGVLPTADVELRQRDAVSTPDRILADGIDAYAVGDYRRAVELLEDAAPGPDLSPVRDVDLGSALARGDRLRNARSVLESLPARTLPDPWGVEARWTLCVIYDRMGERSRADSLLTDLALETGDVAERARKALESRASNR